MIKFKQEDPILGERKMPVYSEAVKNKTLVERDAVFQVDVDTSKISIISNKKTWALGRTITYLITN